LLVLSGLVAIDDLVLCGKGRAKFEGGRSGLIMVLCGKGRAKFEGGGSGLFRFFVAFQHSAGRIRAMVL